MATMTWPDWTHLTWTGPHVKATMPPAHFFEFPPSSQPLVLQPPPKDVSFEHPFTISTEWYNLLLSPTVPITFALVYASIVTILNSWNAQGNHKPWAFSKSRLFTFLVLVHNAFLSVYSLWTCVGMFNAMRRSLEPPTGPYGLAGTIDSLCKLSGPRGFGSAATFNGTTDTWGFTDRTFHLAKDTNLPEFSDVGRMWNEGLAFYGWLFYISKFYEVIDTFIIISKGKKASFLQTYHHAGAMLCMWAGIRYMSPPIWMFVTVNSFIHFIMYAFYFMTTLGIRIPKPIKQTLTTLQITQFVIGATYAFAHLIVAYQVPISTPYIYHLGDAVRSIASSISADASSVISTATATASADPGAWLKKLALRAAGREGLAENIENRMHEKFGIDAVHATKDFVRREETRYKSELRFTHCIDTSGQAFAIYLNVFYLLPLTWLFAQFFIKSYFKRVDEHRRSSIGDRAYIASQSLNDASKGVSRRLSEAFEDYQGTNNDLNSEPVLVDGDQIRKEIKELTEKTKSTGEKAVKKGKEVVNTASKKISEIDTEKVKKDVQADLEKFRKSAKSGAESVQETIKKNQPSDETKEKIRDVAQDAQNAASQVASKAQEATSDAASKAQQVTSDAAAKVKEVYDNATSDESKQYLKETYESSSTTVKEAAKNAREKATELKKDAQKGAEQANTKAGEVKKDVQKGAEQASTKAGEVKKDVQKGAEQANTKAGEVKKDVQKGAEQASTKAGEVKKDVQKGAEQASTKASQLKDQAVDTASEGEGQWQDEWQEVSKKGKKKAGQVKDTAAKKAQDVAETAQDKTEEAKETASKKTSETKKDVEEKADTAKGKIEEKTDAAKGTTEDTTDEAKSTDIDKKDQDKIIAQSQIIRDEPVDTKTKSNTESKTQFKTESVGASHAAVATEGVPEKEKGEAGATDDEDTTNTMSNSNISLNDSVNLSNSIRSNSLTDSYYNVSSMMNSSYSNLSNSMVNDGNVDTLINLPADDLLPDINPFPEIPPMTPRTKERWHARRRGEGSAPVVSPTSPTSPTSKNTTTSTGNKSNDPTPPSPSSPTSLSRPRTSTNSSSMTSSMNSSTSNNNNNINTNSSTVSSTNDSRPRLRHRTSSSANSFISYGNEHGSGSAGGTTSPEIPHSPSNLRYMY